MSRPARGPLSIRVCMRFIAYANDILESGSPIPMDPPTPWCPNADGFGPIQTVGGEFRINPKAW